ncbi:hypothetical protein JCM10213v2_007023 [Rhodosporidiobolus nylandii]
MKVIDMDALLWNDDWVKTPPADFESAVERLTREHNSWCIDGNYLNRSHVFLPRATDILWLDFPLPVTLYRLLKRTWGRWRTQERLFGTNCTEDLRETLSQKGIIWILSGNVEQVHRPVRRRLGELLAEDAELRARLRRRFKWPAEVEQWVEETRKLVKAE